MCVCGGGGGGGGVYFVLLLFNLFLKYCFDWFVLLLFLCRELSKTIFKQNKNCQLYGKHAKDVACPLFG